MAWVTKSNGISSCPCCRQEIGDNSRWKDARERVMELKREIMKEKEKSADLSEVVAIQKASLENCKTELAVEKDKFNRLLNSIFKEKNYSARLKRRLKINKEKYERALLKLEYGSTSKMPELVSLD